MTQQCLAHEQVRGVVSGARPWETQGPSGPRKRAAAFGCLSSQPSRSQRTRRASGARPPPHTPGPQTGNRPTDRHVGQMDTQTGRHARGTDKQTDGYVR